MQKPLNNAAVAAESDPAGATRVEVYEGVAVDAIGWDALIARLDAWARACASRYVCFSNVHALVTASALPSFAAVLAQADLVAPDGAPVAWLLRRRGWREQVRIGGPDAMWLLLEHWDRLGSQGCDVPSIFLLGSTPQTLEKLGRRIAECFPRVRIAGSESPPFRPLTEDEDAALVARVNQSGAGAVWVSLGCPKQEMWMAQHRGRIEALMLGVGAAFDYHAGVLRRAPRWMRRVGLEWAFRLGQEPRRLFARYWSTNLRFCLSVLRREWRG